MALVDKVLNVSVMSKDKFCVLPGQRYVRCASTEGGHVIVIGYTPAPIPQIFVQEALGQGAITEAMLERVKAGLGPDESPGLKLVSNKPGSTPNMDSAERFTKITAALLPMIVAGKPEDFTQSGLPTTSALSASCGFDVSASERDAAFSEVKDSEELKKALEG